MAKSKAFPKKGTGTANPFEMRFSKHKHNVLNRKIKGVRGTPGSSRSSALTHRENAHAAFTHASASASAFVDRRFGENDATLSLEDKMMARYVAHRSHSRSSAQQSFSLADDPDDDPDDANLTHLGHSLAAMPDDMFRRRPHSHDDDEAAGELDKHTVRTAHFGGFPSETPGRRLTHAEIMQQVIAKSKFHRAERARMRDANEQIVSDLDAAHADIAHLLPGRGPKRVHARSDFDVLVRELAGDRRVRPSDRVKTELELARDRVLRLETLERERLERMQPLGESTEIQQGDGGGDDDGEAVETADAAGPGLVYDRDGVLVSGSFAFSRGRQPAAASSDGSLPDDADDSDASKSHDDDEGDESLDEDIVMDNDIIDNDGDIIENDNEIVDNDNENTENNDDHMDNDDENDNLVDNENQIKVDAVPADTLNPLDDEKINAPEAPSVEETHSSLPFVFDAPATYADLVSLLDGKSTSDCDTILKRIKTLYNAQLSQENKAKMETLLNLLLMHVERSANASSLNLEYINLWLLHLHPLCIAHKQVFFNYCMGYLEKAKKALLKHKTLPKLGFLITAEFIGRVYSTSDYRHPIVSRAMLLFTAYLSTCAIKTQRDAVVGLYLCKIVYMYQQQAKRLVPEVLEYLFRVLDMCTCPKPGTSSQVLPHDKPDALYSSVATPADPDFSVFAFLAPAKPPAKDVRITIRTHAVNLLNKFAHLYTASPAFPELFAPAVRILQQSEVTRQAGDKLSARAAVPRAPMQLQHRKPVPVQTYAPKFSETYSIDRKSHDPDRDRATRQKEQRLYVKEYRGAVRELRKDAEFVARKRLEEVIQRDATYKKKIDGIMGDLANQEGAMRGYEKEKKKAKGKKF